MLACFSHAEKIHTVKKNETLSAIAGKYGVTTTSLQAYNGISNPNLVFVGKKLKIPDSSVQQIQYTVRKGDSLGGIASRFGIKLSDLTSKNNIDNHSDNLFLALRNKLHKKEKSIPKMENPKFMTKKHMTDFTYIISSI